MNIRLNKNELAGALSALGKLVSRISPIEAFRSVEIKGHNNSITFRTAALNETICYRIPVEAMEVFTSLVLFDDFRNAVRGCKTKEVELEWNGTFLIVDDTVMPGIADTLPVPDSIPDNARRTSLPENFVESLGIAAPIVNRNDYRKALQGICLESEGIAVTNGKELLHIPVPLNTTEVFCEIAKWSEAKIQPCERRITLNVGTNMHPQKVEKNGKVHCPCCGSDITQIVDEAFRSQRSSAGRAKTEKKTKAQKANMAALNAAYIPEKHPSGGLEA